MKTLQFRVTATISKIETVRVDDDGLTEDEVEEIGRWKAHEQFDYHCNDNEEKYEESSELISNLKEKT